MQWFHHGQRGQDGSPFVGSLNLNLYTSDWICQLFRPKKVGLSLCVSCQWQHGFRNINIKTFVYPPPSTHVPPLQVEDMHIPIQPISPSSPSNSNNADLRPTADSLENRWCTVDFGPRSCHRIPLSSVTFRSFAPYRLPLPLLLRSPSHIGLGIPPTDNFVEVNFFCVWPCLAGLQIWYFCRQPLIVT